MARVNKPSDTKVTHGMNPKTVSNGGIRGFGAARLILRMEMSMSLFLTDVDPNVAPPLYICMHLF